MIEAVTIFTIPCSLCKTRKRPKRTCATCRGTGQTQYRQKVKGNFTLICIPEDVNQMQSIVKDGEVFKVGDVIDEVEMSTVVRQARQRRLDKRNEACKVTQLVKMNDETTWTHLKPQPEASACVADYVKIADSMEGLKTAPRLTGFKMTMQPELADSNHAVIGPGQGHFTRLPVIEGAAIWKDNCAKHQIRLLGGICSECVKEEIEEERKNVNDATSQP